MISVTALLAIHSAQIMNKLVLTLCLVTCRVAQPSKVIWFSVMVSEGLDLNTSSVLPAVEQEVTAVNSNTSILSGYKLQYTIHRHSEVCD